MGQRISLAHLVKSRERSETEPRTDPLEKAGFLLFCGYSGAIIATGRMEKQGREMCLINTMKGMYEIIKESDKIVTF
jgi:hypothetical protein